LPKTERRSAVRRAAGERGIWQRHYWEHLIRDDTDYRRHVVTDNMRPITLRESDLRGLHCPGGLLLRAGGGARFQYHMALLTSIAGVALLVWLVHLYRRRRTC
jgi:hypothetical protein